jgi:hypothetical protein
VLTIAGIFLIGYTLDYQRQYNLPTTYVAHFQLFRTPQASQEPRPLGNSGLCFSPIIDGADLLCVFLWNKTRFTIMNQLCYMVIVRCCRPRPISQMFSQHGTRTPLIPLNASFEH